MDAASPEEARLYLENEKLKEEVTTLTTGNAKLGSEAQSLASEEGPLFLAGLKKKQAGDCAGAIGTFDDFLSRYAASELVPIAEHEALECRSKMAEIAAMERKQFEAFLQSVDALPELEARTKALRDWLAGNADSPHADEVRARLQTLEKMIRLQERYLKKP